MYPLDTEHHLDGPDPVLATSLGSRWLTQGLVSVVRQPLGAVSLVIITAIILVALLADYLAPYDPLTFHPADRLLPPGTDGYLLGTDQFGRDILSRLIHGSRTSLYVGTASVLVGCGLGLIIGLVAAYVGGLLDTILDRLVEVLLAMPMMVLALALIAALGPSTQNVIVAVSVPMIPRMARVVRSAAMALKETTYVQSALVVGASARTVIFAYILPNLAGVVIVMATAQLGLAIVTEAALGFLGLGTQEPYPSWGLMLSGSVSLYARAAPWLPIFPGVTVLLTVLAFNLLGDTVADSLGAPKSSEL